MERWPSGRRRTPGKCVGAESASRVRIPLSPQKSVNQAVARFTLFFHIYACPIFTKLIPNGRSRCSLRNFYLIFSFQRLIFAEINNDKR